MEDNKGVKSVEIVQEMQQSYLDYAMSVIISRALPDARDGLKPVQRRILYAMYDMGIRADSGFKKSARIVGEVLGKYHPHGDSAVYEAMARLAQDFSIRYPLVEGQGNFGSIDGDPPAAMRYTEARLDRISIELLNYIDRDTVDFSRNFDDSLDEPIVLPALMPNLLVNGASGIAVGMATNIPPHNLTEVVDALIYILNHWETYAEITVEDLMRFIKGPDFPTGGIIVLEDARNELLSAYATGRGRLTVRGKVHTEDLGRGRMRLVITEIPYQVNKSGLIERIAQLVRANVIEGIADLRDESDRQGMRVVIELAKSGDAEDILRKLYKHTPLQTTFGIILLALAENKPRVLSLKQALRIYIDHQLEVIRRRTEYELKKAEARAHILKGLLVAIQNLDAVIAIIRSEQDEKGARRKLIQMLKLDEIQAQAILDMPLKRLTQLEHGKLQVEHDHLKIAIAAMKELLSSHEKMRHTIANDLNELKKRYADARRTQIVLLDEGVSSTEVLTANAMIEADKVWVGITKNLKVGKLHPDALKAKGFVPPQWFVSSDTQQTVYCVSEAGKAFGVYAENIPWVENFEDGIDLNSLSSWAEDEKLACVFSMSVCEQNDENISLITVSEKAFVKRSDAKELPFASAQTFTLCKINTNDRLLACLLTNSDTQQLMLITSGGMAIRFDQSDLRPMGLIAAGVNGMKLKGDDILVAAMVVSVKDSMLLLSTQWCAGKIPVAEFPLQGRYGQGVIAVRLADGDRIAGAVADSGRKKQISLCYGDGKMREVKAEGFKVLKRAKALEKLERRMIEPCNGLRLLFADETVTDQKRAKAESVHKKEKQTLPTSNRDESERNDSNDFDEPEQISFF